MLSNILNVFILVLTGAAIVPIRRVLKMQNDQQAASLYDPNLEAIAVKELMRMGVYDKDLVAEKESIVWNSGS